MLIVFLIAISLLSLLITPNLQVSATSKPDLIPHPIQPPQFNMLQASLVITFTPVATAYLPLIRNDPPPTATATPSATPTATTEPPPTATTIPAIPNVQITHIEYNPPGLDSEGEYVDIHNFETGPVLMTNWTLRDEANTVFTFPGFTLNGQASVRIWIRSGVNNQSNLYWGRNSATWNNDGDTAFLRNSTGQQVDICTYAGGGQGIGC
jgi:hypothetical protein